MSTARCLVRIEEGVALVKPVPEVESLIIEPDVRQ